MKRSPIDRLMAAMGRCAWARGESEFVAGMRTQLPQGGEDDNAWLRERAMRKISEDEERRFRRTALKILREVRKAAIAAGEKKDGCA